MMGVRPGEPVPELPQDIADRLSPKQRAEIDDIADAGADARSDPGTFARLFRYRSQLSAKDFANLVLIQRNISPRDGVPIEGVGHPLGTLDDHAEAGVMSFVSISRRQTTSSVLSLSSSWKMPWRR